jgi:hypothetical protein
MHLLKNNNNNNNNNPIRWAHTSTRWMGRVLPIECSLIGGKPRWARKRIADSFVRCVLIDGSIVAVGRVLLTTTHELSRLDLRLLIYLPTKSIGAYYRVCVLYSQYWPMDRPIFSYLPPIALYFLPTNNNKQYHLACGQYHLIPDWIRGLYPFTLFNRAGWCYFSNGTRVCLCGEA